MSAEESLPPHVQYLLSPDSKHDCHFIVGPESGPTETIGAFKAFLVCHSEPFRAMLQDSELTEKGVIAVIDIKPETFRHFLKCLYMNCEDVTVNKFSFQECIDLLYVSDKYLVTYLKEKLVKSLLSILPKLIRRDDIFKALSSPVFLKEKCIEKMFSNIIKSKISTIISFPSFLNISSESLLWILKLDNVATDEVTLWQGALKWATHQADSKDGKVLRQHLLKHLKFVRFCTMNPDDFCIKVVPTNILTHEEVSEVCKSIGLDKPPNLKFICNNINFRDESNSLIIKDEEASFSYCFNNISNGIKTPSQSPSFQFLELDWSIQICCKDNDYLSVFLKCKSTIPPNKHPIRGEMSLINHNGTNLTRAFKGELLRRQIELRFFHLCSWNDLLNPSPSKKYVLNDSIILVAHLVRYY